MPCNYTGYLDAANLAPFGGLIDVDWSNGKSLWTKQRPMRDEALLMDQLRRLRADDPGRKLWAYRGTIYAYPWYEETRRVLDDPAYAPWFLRFRADRSGTGANGTVSPKCDVNATTPAARKCSELYHSQQQTPMFPAAPDDRGRCDPPGCDCGANPCGFYMYNHSAADVTVNGQTFREWFIESYMLANSEGGLLTQPLSGGNWSLIASPPGGIAAEISVNGDPPAPDELFGRGPAEMKLLPQIGCQCAARVRLVQMKNPPGAADGHGSLSGWGESLLAAIPSWPSAPKTGGGK